ncbi:hypothetical protein [Kineococcus rhizosphaerae]|uniref:Uncharacterized protein n=1 Tax=Kineococcus rhizosphaerae TaxID=559628 RepID=A0A2T0R3F4_9ACTN|nr:hypothetical protein [Kineococcus rhizosphaerae]PRY14565.1 hypothetical protein CLV37_106123 [Kineococcus rhizosphaerae]
MSRKVLGLDRFASFVLGLVLLVGGAAAVAWWGGWLARLVPGTGDRLFSGAGDAVRAGWFAPAAAAAALVLAVLAVWWLIAHLPRRDAGDLTLGGSDATGRLQLDADAPARTAADVLATHPGVRSAKGRTVTDRGETVLELRATCEPTADLHEVAAAANRISAQTRQVLGRDDVHGRVVLSVARTDRSRRVR